MSFPYRFHAANDEMSGIAPKTGGRQSREFWRKLARLITLFDERSPTIFLAGEISEFFRNWRARQDSNLRPPA